MRPIKKMLWVSDGHACWTESLEEAERFSWLGFFIAKEKPDIIVLGGDFWDNPSLNGHRGSTLLPAAGKELPKQAAKHCIIRDWEAGREAITRILSPYRNDNERHKKAGHRERIYEPSIYYPWGNHEDFWDRGSAKHPALGQISSSEPAREFLSGLGVQCVPSREKLIVGGIAFQHQFPDKRGNPIPLNSLLSTQLMSSVSGHTHGYGEREQTRADGRVQRATVAGCWKSPQRLNHGDRAGLLVMENVIEGECHQRFIPQSVVAREYHAATRGLAAA